MDVVNKDTEKVGVKAREGGEMEADEVPWPKQQEGEEHLTHQIWPFMAQTPVDVLDIEHRSPQARVQDRDPKEDSWMKWSMSQKSSQRIETERKSWEKKKTYISTPPHTFRHSGCWCQILLIPICQKKVAELAFKMPKKEIIMFTLLAVGIRVDKSAHLLHSHFPLQTRSRC